MNKMIGTAIVGGACLFGLSRLLGEDASLSGRNPDLPAAWEYKVMVLEVQSDVRGTAQMIESLLNTGSQRGWELCRVEQEVFYVMRRPASSNAAGDSSTQGVNRQKSK